ncbi:hypothetical protein ACFQI7_27550 [Paenibacillus allorhizosphaerae]|uniref:Uncharacterized protein n=1 Tax=Paenibacillus allorhizosphaerae TaxID=2849866 RepID=A0ABN7TQC9_9BACL|nr:hypothetical protein [Paenibacillus allorhizosphaerae]CAG7651226.1 hypothetical protein PAECIP111802_04910 [Paenibacillus allorhizosphaerae]
MDNLYSFLVDAAFYSLLFLFFIAGPFIAYRKNYRKIAKTMAIGLAIGSVMFAIDNPSKSSHTAIIDFHGLFFLITLLFVVMPMYVISYICWSIASISKRKKTGTELR